MEKLKVLLTLSSAILLGTLGFYFGQWGKSEIWEWMQTSPTPETGFVVSFVINAVGLMLPILAPALGALVGAKLSYRLPFRIKPILSLILVLGVAIVNLRTLGIVAVIILILFFVCLVLEFITGGKKPV